MQGLMQQKSRSLFVFFYTPSWKLQRAYVIAASHCLASVCRSTPAFQAWLWLALNLHGKSLEPKETHTRHP